MGHNQPATTVQADRYIYGGIDNSRLKQQRTKAMDMWFYWVQDRVKKIHFNTFCKPGVTNLGEYFTKHNPPHHHLQMWPVYLHFEDHTKNDSVRVCYSGLGRGG